MATLQTGKPCVLKCHVNCRLRTARSMTEGRQMDPGVQMTGQINDSQLFLKKISKQNPAYDKSSIFFLLLLLQSLGNFYRLISIDHAAGSA